MPRQMLLLLLLAVLPAAAIAAPTAMQIDTTLEACLSKSEGADAKMKECLSVAYQAMDARMNAVYQLLIRQLRKPESASLLRDAQRRWLSYRDAETKFAYAADPNQGGTAQGLASVDLAYALVKERTTALERYLDSSSDIETP